MRGVTDEEIARRNGRSLVTPREEVRAKIADAYRSAAQHLQSPILHEIANQFEFNRQASELRDEIRKLRKVAGIERDALLLDLDDFLERLVPARAADWVRIEGFRKRIAAELVE